jgi:molybdopterin-containing oxidoreductase family iron-sulfur binding subunit
MSLSGANADVRIPVLPSLQSEVLKALLSDSDVKLPKNVSVLVEKAKKQLKKAGKKGVIITGIADFDAQKMVLDYNQDSVVMDVKYPRTTFMGRSSEVEKVMNGVISGDIKGLISVGVNPVYSFPDDRFIDAYKNLPFSLAFSMKQDETAVLAQIIGATPHYLESWGDCQFKKGTFSLMQPTIRPLFNTQQFQECLVRWTQSGFSYYEFLKHFWSNNILESGNNWNQALHDGVIKSKAKVKTDANTSIGQLLISKKIINTKKSPGELELTLYTKTGLGDGQQANNPWLQELPDPITRTTWDNYITISATDASRLGIENNNVANGALNGSYVNIIMGETVINKVPVLIQPGQAKGSIGLALGYGRTSSIQKEMQTGVNAFRLYKEFSPIQTVTIDIIKGEHEFACVQLHNTMMGRDIIRETTLEIFNTKDASKWNPVPVVSKDHEEISVNDPGADLWTSFDRTIGPHFNLSIDLNSCTGCGACVIACHAENNVPVVGKEEVRKSRDMHWLRIDRYYSSEQSFKIDLDKKENISGLGSSLSEFGDMENPSENPQVAFMPVMCQHCNHAPCETVCPVAATSHGRQGQNQMTYNRCIGTRYCANNCPYKVRRFNWFLYARNDEFDFNMNNDLGRMVLNPDVVVRSRGVMEKCSFCIQSTQAIILKAKREGRPVKKGEFNDSCACSAACDTGAMRFGDINDEESVISELIKDDRAYHLLAEVGTKPNVVYQTKIRNTNEA